MPANTQRLESLRLALRESRLGDAEKLLHSAMAEAPRDPEVLTEAAWVLAYLQAEADALNLLTRLPESPRLASLRHLLAQSFCGRVALAERQGREDAEAAVLLARAKSSGPCEGTFTGTVSACLIVKNEERNLPRCLRSLTGFVDEVVIVDTGSTDSTLEIARQARAVVGTFPWIDDFAAARNASLELATKDWILWIDADEEMDPAGLEEFRRAIVRPQFGGYCFRIENASGRDEGLYTHVPMRLFRRHPEVRFQGRVHEQISQGLETLGLPWAFLPSVRLIHNGYTAEALQEQGKIERTVALLQREAQDHPADPFPWFNLSKVLAVAELWEPSVQAGLECISRLTGTEPYAAEAYARLAASCSRIGDVDAALAACDAAEQAGTYDVRVAFERAGALLQAGRYEEAVLAADASLWMDWPEGLTGDASIGLYKRHTTKARALLALDRDAEALAVLQLALQRAPKAPTVLWLAGEACERLGQIDFAIRLYTEGLHSPHVRARCAEGLARLGRPVEGA